MNLPNASFKDTLTSVTCLKNTGLEIDPEKIPATCRRKRDIHRMPVANKRMAIKKKNGIKILY